MYLVRIREVDRDPAKVLVQVDRFLSDFLRLLVRLDYALLDLVYRKRYPSATKAGKLACRVSDLTALIQLDDRLGLPELVRPVKGR